MKTQTQRTKLIEDIRQAVTNLLNAKERLDNLSDQWTATDAGTVLQTEDFLETNAGLAVADLAAVMGVSLPALNALLAQGHATNLYALKK